MFYLTVDSLKAFAPPLMRHTEQYKKMLLLTRRKTVLLYSYYISVSEVKFGNT